MAIKISYQTKITLSALIFSIAVFSLIFFLIIPEVNRVLAIRTQMDNQRQQLEKDYSQGKNLEKVAANLKTVEPRQAEIEQVFIKNDDADALNFFTSLETIAEKNKILEKANLGAPTPLGQSYSKIGLQLSLQGNFNNLVGFLSDMEQLRNYIDIRSMQITAEDYDDSSGGLNSTSTRNLLTQVSADSYWQDQ